MANALSTKLQKQLSNYVPNWYKLPLGKLLGQAIADQIAVYSHATAGGAASEAITFTGLAAADTVLSVSRVSGGNAVSVVGWSSQILNGLTVTFSGDPGASAIVQVVVSKAANPDT